jgi:hypothetical protein
MVMQKEFIEHDYQIEIDDKDPSKRSYSLNGAQLEFVEPSLVEAGSLVWFDKLNQTSGIVQAIRKDKYFVLYDVFRLDNGKVQEVAEFRVYRVA